MGLFGNRTVCTKEFDNPNKPFCFIPWGYCKLLGGIMNLDMLKQAMKPIQDFGKDEISIEVNGSAVTLRTLLPAEEVACQKYATGVLDRIKDEIDLENDYMSRHGALDYFDKFRIEVISYSICQIGELDFRGVDYIETGEVLPNGTPKKITKELALRNLIEESWSRAMITICFSKYGDLVTKLSEQAEKIASRSISDLDAEIQRLETKLEKTKQERDKRAVGDPSVTAVQIKNLVEVGRVMEEEMEEASKRAEELETEREREIAIEKERLRKLDEERRKQEEAKKKAAPKRQSVIPEEVPPPTPAPQPTREQIEQARKGSKTPEGDLLGTATPVGSVKGIEAYRLPSQTISDRGQNSAPRPAQLDPDPRKSSANPNFKPRR